MHEVDLESFSAARDSGAVVIDVRDPSEFRSGHVEGAVNIPNGDLRARLYEVPRKVPVYLVCANGARSLESAEFLQAVGYDARSVAGGMFAWLVSGRPLTYPVAERTATPGRRGTSATG